MFFRESNIVQNTYGSVDQLVLASEVATRYVHEAVDDVARRGQPRPDGQRQRRHLLRQHGQRQVPRSRWSCRWPTAARARTFECQPVHGDRGQLSRDQRTGTGCTYGGSTQSFLLINYLTNGTGGSPVFTYTLQGGEVVRRAPTGLAHRRRSAAARERGQYDHSMRHGADQPGVGG